MIPMTEAQAGDAAILEAKCFSLPWSRDALAEAARRDDMIFLCALVDGVFAGYAGMLCVLDEGQICNIAVSPAYRRMGVGSRLLAALKGEAARLGLSLLTLEVRASNTAAQTLYERNGFERVGLRRAFYTHPREDAFLYNCELK